MNYDIAIVGAGASGMALAIKLAREGKRVVLLEKQSRGGRKILASGNGKCNITNMKLTHKDYILKNKNLLKSIINNSSYQQIESFFKSLGLEFFIKDDGKVYPKSQRASIVLELLEFELQRLNVKIFYNIENLKIEKGFKLNFNNLTIYSQYLVIATGSKAAPQLGGDGSGLDIAKSFGHKIVKPLPALVAFNSKDRVCRVLNGIKIEAGVKLLIDGIERKFLVNDLLFAKYGVSGLAILDLSLYAVQALDAKRDVDILIDFFPGINKDSLLNYLKSRIDKNRKLPLNLWLGGVIDPKIAFFITSMLKIDNKTEKDLNTKLLKTIIHTFKNYRVNIDSYRDFKYAEVAMGGVDTNEIKSNLESKYVDKLYFMGEVLDIVGKRGGYNFSFAWCSAFRVAKDIVSDNKNQK